MPITVGELKKAMENLPDDMRVVFDEGDKRALAHYANNASVVRVKEPDRSTDEGAEVPSDVGRADWIDEANGHDRQPLIRVLRLFR